MRKYFSLLAFSLTWIIHLAATFVAWSIADSPAMRLMDPWSILSFPVFYISGGLGDMYPWQVMAANSAIWALALSFLADRIYKLVTARSQPRI